ncbi:lipase family protein [Nocardia asteroides]|uniref:lipase family protein n=1 Tax=Nocardia asteroides TaxID=1824 RepID=UPI00342EB7DB
MEAWYDEGIGQVRQRRVIEEPDYALLPSRDPFMDCPADIAAIAPGAVIRSRPVDLALFGAVRQRVQAWQLLYRSNDLHSKPEAAVTTVVLPAGASPESGRPLLLFQSAIDAVTERCAPSYSLRHGTRASGSITRLEWPLIAYALTRGWAVSIADHGGRKGSFGAPREPGYRTLDGARAALSFEPLRLGPSTQIAVWGYSGGGMASSWAVEMAPEYAPELGLVGAVLGAPVGDPGEVLLRLDGGRFAAFPLMVIAALQRLYPALQQAIAADVSAEGRTLLARAEKLPPITALIRMSGLRIDDYLTRPLNDILAEPDVRAVLDDIRLGLNAPACPLLVLQPLNDQVIHCDGVDRQVERYQHAGVHVTYVRDRLSDHFTLLPLSTALSLSWLADRVEGKPLPAPSTRTVLSLNASAAGLRGLAAIVGTALTVAVGRAPVSRKLIGQRTEADDAA